LCRDHVEPLAAILADPMQRVATARTIVIIDVDYHLNPRQMRWKRASIDAALGGPRGALDCSTCLLFRLVTCRYLLDLFESKQQLILR